MLHTYYIHLLHIWHTHNTHTTRTHNTHIQCNTIRNMSMQCNAVQHSATQCNATQRKGTQRIAILLNRYSAKHNNYTAPQCNNTMIEPSHARTQTHTIINDIFQLQVLHSDNLDEWQTLPTELPVIIYIIAHHAIILWYSTLSFCCSFCACQHEISRTRADNETWTCVQDAPNDKQTT